MCSLVIPAAAEDCRTLHNVSTLFEGQVGFSPHTPEVAGRRLGNAGSHGGLEGVNQRRFFTTDVNALPGVGQTVQSRTRCPYDILPSSPASVASAIAVTAQMYSRFDIFAAQEDVTTIRFQRERGRSACLLNKAAVRQLFHQQTVL